MSKAVLISIRHKWAELIVSGRKTTEIRKTKPKLEPPFRCYIYQTLPKSGDWNDRDGRVISEFVCDEIDTYDYEYCTHPEIGMDYDCGDNWFCIDDADLKKACLTYKEFRDYAGNKDVYGWHISELKVYDKPKKLTDFMKPCDPDPDGVPLCFQCKRNVENYGCGGTILRPPQSWCYVEEL